VKTIQSVTEFQATNTQKARSIVTIGNFDGVHLGHRELIAEVRRQSAETKSLSCVFTFEPHPVQVLFPERKLRRLFPREDQVEQLALLGMDYLVVQPFSRALSQTPPVEFLENYILKALNPISLVVGYDFSFGANRQGSVEGLEEFSRKSGIGLKVIPPFEVGGVIASSTRIRRAITEGEITLANKLLGRRFYLQGLVEKGDQRGTKIGFPTANLAAVTECIPLKGVYATQTRVNGKSLRSVTNVGTNPTFLTSDDVRVETHILDFDLFIYGQEITVEFISRIRDEQKFSSVEELKRQIEADVLSARVAHD
jgi:riboflavin kinase / FMN adenylyltransferase